MKTRKSQMMTLLFLTSLSLLPVYVLLGWSTGGHGPDTVHPWLWLIEAGAWGLRALVESAALIYLFSTQTDNQYDSRKLALFEVALIVLIGVTVTLIVISNGLHTAVSSLPPVLFYIWSASVAAFAPLMLGSVGFAYKAHKEVSAPIPEIITLTQRVSDLMQQVSANSKAVDVLRQRVDNSGISVDTRREKLLSLLHTSDKRPTQAELAKSLGVSLTTIRADIKELNGKAK
jgi:hypothetical protein